MIRLRTIAVMVGLAATVAASTAVATAAPKPRPPSPTLSVNTNTTHVVYGSALRHFGVDMVQGYHLDKPQEMHPAIPMVQCAVITPFASTSVPNALAANPHQTDAAVHAGSGLDTYNRYMGS